MTKYYCGQNDGGIKRGDRAETGDEQARPIRDDTGATPEDLDDLEVLEEDDPVLGLTDIGEIPPEDWAADTGPDQVPDPESDLEWERAEREPKKKGC